MQTLQLNQTEFVPNLSKTLAVSIKLIFKFKKNTYACPKHGIPIKKENKLSIFHFFFYLSNDQLLIHFNYCIYLVFSILLALNKKSAS